MAGTASAVQRDEDPVYFGGWDPARRQDSAALVIMGWYPRARKFVQTGQRVWDNIDYRQQADDIYRINKKYRMHRMCYDRGGVGDAAGELISPEIRKEAVLSSMQKKEEIITLIHALAQNGYLVIGDADLYRQMLEQQRNISDAGNVLYRHPPRSHDDIFWAMGYACYAARRMFGSVYSSPRYAMARSMRDTRAGLLSVRGGADPDFDPSWTVSDVRL